MRSKHLSTPFFPTEELSSAQGLIIKDYVYKSNFLINILRAGEHSAHRFEPSSQIALERHDYYPRKSENDHIFKKGTALVFSQGRNQLTENMSDLLEYLEFKPQYEELPRIKETLNSGITIFNEINLGLV